MTESPGCPICAFPSPELFCVRQDDSSRPKPWDVMRCPECEHGWTWPVPTNKQLKDYYSDGYYGDIALTLNEFESGSLQQSRSWRRETEKVHLVERFCQSGRLLDVGCAGASFLLALDPDKWHRVGIDTSSHAVTMVRSRFPELEIYRGDIFLTDLDAQSFDVITFWHVFEHVADPEEVLLRVKSLLRPGGYVIVSLPNFSSYQARLFNHYWFALDVPRHLHHFSPYSLERLISKSGMLLEKHLFFSRLLNFHQLKYSLINWSEDRFGGRAPYYLLKPMLGAFQLLEGLTTRYGTLTTVAVKPE